MDESQLISNQKNRTPEVSPGTYSPVIVYLNDTAGVMFLFILSSILLAGWMRSEARYRKSIIHKEEPNGCN